MASFDKFLRKYICRIIGALCVGGLHLFLLLKGGIFLMLYLDFPITNLWQFFIGPVVAGGRPLIFLCFLGGTLMYAILGWLIGWMGDWLRQSSQEA
ncbi:MAG: hypothetical protein OEY91_13930 [Nitrospirota bacterium]|nr:hypothetical protein [Nitrospirota bacterium]